MKRKKIIVTGTVSVVFLAVLGLAKFVSNQAADEPGKAKNMYFVSNVLTEREEVVRQAEKTYPIANWKNGKKIRIEMRNYPDSQRFTRVPIEYQVTVEQDPNAVIAVDGGIKQMDSKTIRLPASTSKADQQKQVIDIYPSDDFLVGKTERALTVTATSTKPYQTELTATFLLQKAATGVQVVVEDENQSPYAKLIVWAEEKQNVTLNWEADKVVPDQTNKFLLGKTIIGDTDQKKVELGVIDAISAATIYLMKYDEEQNYTPETNRPFKITAVE